MKVKIELSKGEALLTVAALRQYNQTLQMAAKRPSQKKKFGVGKAEFNKAAQEVVKLADGLMLAIEEAEHQPANTVVDVEPEVCGETFGETATPYGGRFRNRCALFKGHGGGHSVKRQTAATSDFPECKACGSSSCVCPTERTE